MSEIEKIIEKDVEELEALMKKVVKAVDTEVDRGLMNVDSKELGEAVDMIKDLACSKESIVKCHYYMNLLEAMEEATYGEDYDRKGKLPRKSMNSESELRGNKRDWSRRNPDMYEAEGEGEDDMDIRRDRDMYGNEMYDPNRMNGSSMSRMGNMNGMNNM